MKAILGNNRFAKDRQNHCHDNGITWGSGCHWKHLKSHVSQLIRKVLSNDDMIQNLVQNEITTIFKTNEMLLTLQDIDLYTSCHNILFGILFGPAVHESSEVQDIIRRHKLKTKPSCDPAEWYTCSSWLLFQGSTNTLDPSYSEDIKKIIQGRACLLRSAKNDMNPNNESGLVDLFIASWLDKDKSTNTIETAVDTLASIVSDMCASGTQPMAFAIQWMIYLLARNPKVQDKIYDEIMNEELSNSGAKAYRMATLYEIFRVGNILPIPIPRCATEAFSISDLPVRKGCPIIYNLDPIFKDVSYWGESVDKFVPERFLDERKLIRTERMVMFGFGKRRCLGESIVWNTLMLYLTEICTKFEVSAGRQNPTDYGIGKKASFIFSARRRHNMHS
ncbi:cytochrome P450 2J6 isoform X2 [Folsomia candida]|nr:cytochrome P450 2J6 isoform X2 [Folsomia candida]